MKQKTSVRLKARHADDTTKLNLSDISPKDTKMVLRATPVFFVASNSSKVHKRKQKEMVETFYNKHAD